MISNLKTTLRAYPRLSSSMIGNFATKSELDMYLTKSEFTSRISKFIKEVDNPVEGLIYGRCNGAWVPVSEIKKPIKGALCYGYFYETDDADPMTLTDEEFNSLARCELSNGVYDYKLSITSDRDDFVWLWFCSTMKIVDVKDISYPDAPVPVEFNNCGTKVVVMDEQEVVFNTYNVGSAAFEGVPMDFMITLEEIR